MQSKLIYLDEKSNQKEFKLNLPINSNKFQNFKDISGLSKIDTILSILDSIKSGNIPILYDRDINFVKDRLNAMDLKNFNIEDEYIMFFTSGTTGVPTSTIKTKENIFSELRVLSKLISNYEFERVIVTVPFFHIYGFLFGLMLPLNLNLEVFVKEDFMPQDIISLAKEKKSLIVTNPIFIKSLIKLNSNLSLNESLFISSTSILLNNEVKSFIEKYNTNILQVYGSTETGGIAYKFQDNELWTPLNSVEISLKNDFLSVKSKFISKYTFEDKFLKLNGKFLTNDIVELIDNKFKLLGRSSNILKISGKRVSTIEIAKELEKLKGIKEVLVTIEHKSNTLKDEILNIYIVKLDEDFNINLVREVFINRFNILNIKFNITFVKEILKNKIGKKVIFNL